VTVTPARDEKYEIGDLAGIYPQILPSITQVEPGGAAEAAGLLAGDRIRAVDGRPVTDVEKFVEYISARPGVPIVLAVRRGDRELTLTTTPADVGGRGRIGVGIGFGFYQRYGPIEAFAQSVRHNVQLVRQTFLVVGKIFRGELSAKGALAGPIEIAAQSGAAARAGFPDYVSLMGFISISIAIVNLLPIPILDGGQIFILLVEGTIRRDLSIRIKETIAQVGFVLIVLLMLTVIYFDIAKNWPPGFLSGS
jgi:regulator of sigma E protease